MEARPDAPVGVHISSITAPGHTAGKWLESIEQRTRLLLDDPSDLAPDALNDAKEAIRVALLAQQAIDQNDAAGAAWAAMHALHAAWCVEVKVGARSMLVRDRKRQAGTRKLRATKWPLLDEWLGGGFNSEVHRVAGFRAVLRSAF